MENGVKCDESRIRIMSDSASKSIYYNSYIKSFTGNGGFVDGNSVVLSLPADVSLMDKYKVSSGSNLQRGSYYCTVYNYDPESTRAKLIVMHNRTENYGIALAYVDAFIVTKVEGYWNDVEAELDTKITVSNGTAVQTLTADKNFVDLNSLYNAAYTVDEDGNTYKIGVGDIIVFNAIDNKIVNMRLIYDADEKNPAWYGTDPEDKTTKIPEGNENYCDVLGNICGSTGFASEIYENTNPFAYSNGQVMKSGKYFGNDAAHLFFAHGYAYSNYENLLTLTTQNLSIPFDGVVDRENYYYQTFDPQGVQIVLVKKDGKNVTVMPGTVDDIKTYDQFGTGCSRIIAMHSLHFQLRTIFVFIDD